MIIHPATPDDAAAIAAVRVTSWRATYRGTVPDSYLAAMLANEDAWRKLASGGEPGAELLVCEADGRVVGFAGYGAARPPDFGYGGELYAIYYLPEATGMGHGSAMLAAVARGLTRLGHTDMLLWVMEANARGRRFYETRGGSLVPDSRKSFEIDGRVIWEVAYGFRPLPAPTATR